MSITLTLEFWPFTWNVAQVTFLFIIFEMFLHHDWSPPVVNSFDWTWFGKAQGTNNWYNGPQIQQKILAFYTIIVVCRHTLTKEHLNHASTPGTCLVPLRLRHPPQGCRVTDIGHFSVLVSPCKTAVCCCLFICFFLPPFESGLKGNTQRLPLRAGEWMLQILRTCHLKTS